MNEKFQAFEENTKKLKLGTIYRVREAIIDQGRTDLHDAIVPFVNELRALALEHFGTTAPLQKIEMYQALIGGSPEGEDETLGEFREIVEARIAALMETFKAELATNDSSGRS